MSKMLAYVETSQISKEIEWLSCCEPPAHVLISRSGGWKACLGSNATAVRSCPVVGPGELTVISWTCTQHLVIWTYHAGRHGVPIGADRSFSLRVSLMSSWSVKPINVVNSRNMPTDITSVNLLDESLEGKAKTAPSTFARRIRAPSTSSFRTR
jgi:hypothetical protein